MSRAKFPETKEEEEEELSQMLGIFQKQCVLESKEKAKRKCRCSSTTKDKEEMTLWNRQW